ncbi:alkaline shock protein 24 [Thermacetogenium phaeum DSM 12270]|uniref:Alkaline shock protein 24 n=1 Tax=Thermacetogenium phaeum (strain ATCC BAA-254 / DSM 26808 / PB) TaxID=1089553 RepID=K4LIR6_THEPS|nr:alkaline shock response membrane anchor protein AmaP [Thermacetogenium phaeum]AFV11840.1 alkaline shock protein 24 [Thermacetogenium phaeum DSM 12270]
MGISYRFFVAVFALFILLLGGCAFAVALGWSLPLTHLEDWLALPGNRWAVAAVSAFLVLMALWILMAALRRPREHEVIIRESLLGRIEIAATALESLIRRAARQVRDVREVKPILRSDREGLVVLLHMNINPDANLPDISQEVQERVQEYLEKKAGVQVSQVQVLIRSVAAEQRPRVE